VRSRVQITAGPFFLIYNNGDRGEIHMTLQTLDTVIANSTKDPFDANYRHGTIHPQYSSPTNTSIIPLFPEEETYFNQKGFAVMYAPTIPNPPQLPIKTGQVITFPYVSMGKYSESAMQGELQIILSGCSNTLHLSHWHPSVIPLDRLVNTVEHDILSHAKRFNKSENPITVFVDDESWRSVINVLHEKYTTLKEYSLPA